jgi:hypothetical protein
MLLQDIPVLGATILSRIRSTSRQNIAVFAVRTFPDLAKDKPSIRKRNRIESRKTAIARVSVTPSHRTQ